MKPKPPKDHDHAFPLESYAFLGNDKLFNHVRPFATLWTIAHQASQFVGFFSQEYWNRLPFPSPEDLPNLWTEPSSHVSPTLQVDSLPSEPSGKHLGNIRQSNICWIKQRISFLVFHKYSICTAIIYGWKDNTLEQNT